ncbi:hypothetical protein B0H13DRAFT_1858528 [Mycena leptocephala]|nr:hypothetical protein B0H13DRAFT_1858528 [Mycena leptocephala]
MLESQVLSTFAPRIRLTLEDACRKNDGVWPKGHLRLFPRTFAEGTAAKAHETISVDVGDCTETPEPEPVPMNPHDEKRIPRNAPWILEGNMLVLSKADFDEIVSTCVPGNNKNPAKAKRSETASPKKSVPIRSHNYNFTNGTHKFAHNQHSRNANGND